MPRGPRFLSGLQYWHSVQSYPADPAPSPSLLLLPDPLENSSGKGAMAELGTGSSKTIRQIGRSDSQDKALRLLSRRKLFAFLKGLPLYSVHDSMALCMLRHSTKDWHGTATGVPNRRQQTWLEILTLALTSSVTLDKLFNVLPSLSFYSCKMVLITGLLREWIKTGRHAELITGGQKCLWLSFNIIFLKWIS